MSNTYTAADLHLSHANILTFEKEGKKLRPFASMEEHNETIIDNWNKIVRDNDNICVLGDTLFAQETGWPALARLRGKKHLIEGNHDKRHKKKLVEYFVSIDAMKIYDDLIMTHMPVHVQCVGRYKNNVHGHLHNDQIGMMYSSTTRENGFVVSQSNSFVPDPRYLCVSLEHTNFSPISIDEVRSRIVMRRLKYGDYWDIQDNEGGPG